MIGISEDALYPVVCIMEFKKLSDTEKVGLINYFHECYFNTNQEVEEFAPEFQRVVAHILSDCVPISLDCLVDFVNEDLWDKLSDDNKKKFLEIYKAHKQRAIE